MYVYIIVDSDLGSLNQRKVTEFKIPSLIKSQRFPEGGTGLWMDDCGGPAVYLKLS